jgi:hypothetical protein
MVSLGVEGGGKVQNLGGAKLDAEAAALAALYRNGYGSFGHGTSS